VSLAVKAARASSQGGISGPVGAGGLFSTLGNLAGRAVRGAVGLATGGPAGAVRGIVSSGGRPSGVPLQMPGLPSGVKAPGALGFAQRFVPGGETGRGAGCGSGYHPNKTGYFLQSGQYVAPGERCVKNRRRNPLNPKALSKAIGRIEGGKRAAKRLSGITIRKSCK
jgi:hypothetical protein